MNFKVELAHAALVNMYVPKGTVPHSMQSLSELAGGCTVIEASGEWKFKDKWCNEPVLKYEWVFSRLGINLKGLEQMGIQFLTDNPHEIEVLFTLSNGTDIKSVRVMRSLEAPVLDKHIYEGGIHYDR